jgi:hypothetical protein
MSKEDFSDPGVGSCFTVGQTMRRIGNALSDVDANDQGPLTLAETEYALLAMLRWVKKLKREGKSLYMPPPG